MMRYFLLYIILLSPMGYSAQVPTKLTSTGPVANQLLAMNWLSISKDSDSLRHGCDSTNCYYGPYLKYANKSNPTLALYSRFGSSSTMTFDGTKYTTWESVSAKYQETYGTSGSFSATWTNSSSVLNCAVFGVSAYQLRPGEGVPESMVNLKTPPGLCTSIVTTNSCLLNEGNVLLEHGELSPSGIEGHQAVGELTISCSAALPVKISTSPNNDLLLKSGEISSHLTINDEELNTVINLNDGVNDLVIKSVLHAENTITAGAFSGSQTVIMTIQ